MTPRSSVTPTSSGSYTVHSESLNRADRGSGRTWVLTFSSHQTGRSTREPDPKEGLGVGGLGRVSPKEGREGRKEGGRGSEMRRRRRTKNKKNKETETGHSVVDPSGGR